MLLTNHSCFLCRPIVAIVLIVFAGVVGVVLLIVVAICLFVRPKRQTLLLATDEQDSRPASSYSDYSDVPPELHGNTESL
jgi:cytoskeletal protein RodZ